MSGYLADLRPFATSRVGVRDGNTADVNLRCVVAQERYREVAIVAFNGPTEGLPALEARDIGGLFGDRALFAEMIGKANYPARLMIASKHRSSSLRFLPERRV
jgi:hypothetical protein